ncbi:uncharacterized protein LOC143888655 [Tasmannia lanceolata]|uniref:uncharacterized protein LOC143888655 n=1 Tax=Tasmannia lanceolata TaxID=3420 RepID=UPI0040649F86
MSLIQLQCFMGPCGGKEASGVEEKAAKEFETELKRDSKDAIESPAGKPTTIIPDEKSNSDIWSQTQFENFVRKQLKSRSGISLKDALGFFDRLVAIKPFPSIFTFNHLLGALARMKHYSTVVSMYRKMSSVRMDPNICTLSILVNSYCCLNRVDLGFATLGSILKRGHEPNVVTYNSLIHGFCNLGRSKEAIGFFNEMEDRDISPNVITFNILVNALCKQGMVTKAHGLLEVLIQRGENPDIITYNALVDGYCLEGQMDEAMSRGNARNFEQGGQKL